MNFCAHEFVNCTTKYFQTRNNALESVTYKYNVHFVFNLEGKCNQILFRMTIKRLFVTHIPKGQKTSIKVPVFNVNDILNFTVFGKLVFIQKCNILNVTTSIFLKCKLEFEISH